MKNTIAFFFFLVLPFTLMAQHDHHADDSKKEGDNHNHLAHMQASRTQTFYGHNLPAPKLMSGIGTSNFKIETKSEKTQQYFNQGIALLHDFWDFEAYRAFREAIRLDSTAIMPYWGLMQTLGSMEDSVYMNEKKEAILRLKALKNKASEHEKLYAELSILGDSLKEKAYPEIVKSMS